MSCTTIHCENPRHNLKNFLRKHPKADGKFPAINMDPEEWAVNLDHHERNTAKCCQMCSIQEDIKRVTSPGWNDQPASYNPFEWKVWME